MTRLQQLAFRAALAALRALKSIRNEVAFSVGLDPAAEVRVHSGPWCIMRYQGERPVVFVRHEHGGVSQYIIAKEWHRDGVVRADAWDLVAGYHRKPGPKRDLHDRRAIKARESASGASMRLRVSENELRSRALSLTGSRAARTPAEWDALAEGMARCRPRSSS